MSRGEPHNQPLSNQASRTIGRTFGKRLVSIKLKMATKMGVVRKPRVKSVGDDCDTMTADHRDNWWGCRPCPPVS
jgi:hypothetical protein